MLDIVEVARARELLGDELSCAQETYLRALYGLPLDAEQLDVYARATGNAAYSPREYRESTAICGRRSGKSSKLAANIAIYEACFRTHVLAPGERGWVVVIAATRRQAAIAFNYVLARLEVSQTLRRMIAGEPRADEVDLVNGISIGVWACNYRSIRGLSVVSAIADEMAFWHDDLTGANPASEVLRAIRPGMANFPNAKLIKISSPYAKQGVVWDDWNTREKHPEMLVWRLDTRTMNPSLSAAFLDAEERRDPESFAREYGADFYESASAFLSADAVEAAVVRGRYELPPIAETHYTAALDAAFRGDRFAFAITHRAGERVVQDFTRSWRGTKSNPVNLARTIAEIVETLKRFNVSKIHGDQFCAEPIRQSLAVMGVEFEQTTTLGARASGMWNSLRTLVASGQFELLDDAETVAELKRLELIVTSGGNQRIEAASGHDDRAVVLAVAAHQCVARPVRVPWVETIVIGGESDERLWRRI